MSAKRRLLLPFLVIALIGALTVSAPSASAHIHTITASCKDGLSVKVTGYHDDNPAHANSITVHFDDAIVAHDPNFGSSFSFTYPNPDKTQSHTYQVDLTPWSDADDPVHTGIQTIPSCETPPPTTAPPTTAPPTTAPPTTTKPPVTTTQPPVRVVPPTPRVVQPRTTG